MEINAREFYQKLVKFLISKGNTVKNRIIKANPLTKGSICARVVQDDLWRGIDMKTKSMTEGKSFSLILKFALPLMLGSVFQEFYTITDTVIVGQFLGVGALAAVGIGGWITWMLLAAVQGFCQGFSVLAAQAFGAKKTDDANVQMGNSLLLSVIISVACATLGQFILAPLLKLLNTPAEVFGDALLYLRIYYAGCPITMAYNYAASHLRAYGNSKAPLIATIIASIVNIGLDILFVGPFGWGIAGAVIATLIAQLVAAIYSFCALLKIDFVKFQKSNIKMDTSLSAKQMKMGLPMSVQYIMISIGGIIVQFVVNRYGITFIAGMTATNRLYTLLETAAISYGYAITTYVGQNVGAGRIDRIKSGMVSGNVIAVATSFIIMTAMFVFGKNLVSMFISGTPEEISEALKVAWKYLLIMSAFLPVLYSLHIFKAAVVGFGDSFFAMMSGVAELVLRVGASFLLPVYFGKMNLFYAEPLAWIAAWLVLIAGYVYLYRKVCIDNRI